MLPSKENPVSAHVPNNADKNQDEALVPEKNDIDKCAGKQNEMVDISASYDKDSHQTEQVKVKQSSRSLVPLIDENHADEVDEEVHHLNPPEKIPTFLKENGINGSAFNEKVHALRRLCLQKAHTLKKGFLIPLDSGQLSRQHTMDKFFATRTGYLSMNFLTLLRWNNCHASKMY